MPWRQNWNKSSNVKLQFLCFYSLWSWSGKGISLWKQYLSFAYELSQGNSLEIVQLSNFLKLGVIIIHDMNIQKNTMIKWGHRALFTRQRALKIGCFYWLRVKNSNHLHTEFSLGYLEDAKSYLESKVSFIDISSIASFKLFLIAWLREYCTFSDSSVVSLKSSPWPKYIQLGTIFQKKNRVLLSNFFSFSNTFFIRLFSANTWKKK